VLGGNEEACGAAESHTDIRFWAVLDPRIQETYTQVESLLAHPRCRGIKIHPTCHDYSVREYGEAIFEFAASQRTVIITHTGDANCFPDAFIPFANRYPAASLILAHMGYSSDGNFSRQVYALRQAKAGNVFIDTSSAMSMLGRLVEWAVSQVGHERLLFGSDTPLYSVASQKARIEYADFEQQTQQAILFDNAARLLGEEQVICEEE
jgi:predicted TIM-barrel fold metal-dependent hydrolase